MNVLCIEGRRTELIRRNVLRMQNLLPRLPVLERAYRSLYPALFNAAPSSSLPIRSSSSATFAAASSRADPKKIVISGGSSGGYTVLSALCLYPHAFAAGTSKYGICDLEMLAKDSHKL